jgi:hypothetical protein
MALNDVVTSYDCEANPVREGGQGEQEQIRTESKAEQSKLKCTKQSKAETRAGQGRKE